MTSEAQKNSGYTLPTVIDPEATRCIAVRFPDDDEYHRAIIAQITDLTKWWNWKRTSPQTQEGKLSAEAMQAYLKYTPVGKTIPCEIAEGGEDIIVTTAEELCKAVECGVINVFERAISGTAGNTGTQISFDEDGVPILTEGGLASGGGQSVDYQLELMGQMEYIENQLEEFITDYEDFYNSTSGNATVMESFMTSKYLLNAGITDAVASYIAHRGASNPAPIPTLDNLDRVMMCKGAIKQVVSAWVIDDAIQDKVLRLELLDALTQEQYTQWAEQSSLISDDFVNTECYTFPTFSGTVLASDWNHLGGDADCNNFVGLMQNNRNYIVRISGLYTIDADNAWDGMYEKVNGGWSYKPMRIQATTFADVRIPKTQPVRSETGYTVIYEKATGSKLGWNDNGILNYSGSFSMSFEDTGTNI